MPIKQENNKKILYLSLAVLKIGRKDFDKGIRKNGLSYPQYGALRMVKAGSQNLSELAKRLMLEPATLVPVVDALETKGLLKRQSDLKDRRKNLLTLTAKGKKLISSMPIDRPGILSKALAKIGAQKSAQLIDLLQELVETMQPNSKILEEIKKFI